VSRITARKERTLPLSTLSCAPGCAHDHRPQRWYRGRRRDQERPAGGFETIPALEPRPAPKRFHVGAGRDFDGSKRGVGSTRSPDPTTISHPRPGTGRRLLPTGTREVRRGAHQPPDPEAGAQRPPSGSECCWCSSGQWSDPASCLPCRPVLAGGLPPGLPSRAQQRRGGSVLAGGCSGRVVADLPGAAVQERELTDLDPAALVQERVVLGQRDRRLQVVGGDQRVTTQRGVSPGLRRCVGSFGW
jgi:hypothetical protein